MDSFWDGDNFFVSGISKTNMIEGECELSVDKCSFNCILSWQLFLRNCILSECLMVNADWVNGYNDFNEWNTIIYYVHFP